MTARHSSSRLSRRRGSAVIEAAMGCGALVILATLLLKASVTATVSQRWTVVQVMTDAYLTRELALARRLPMNELAAMGSPWPVFPSVSVETVEVGLLPGGGAVTAELRRTRVPDPNNLPAAGGSGNAVTNPGRMEAWKVQSYLVYEIAGRNYVKSRTTLRVR